MKVNSFYGYFYRMATAKDVRKLSDGRIEYRGHKFSGFNKPRDSWLDDKSKVVLARKGNAIKIVHFGDPDMPIKKQNKSNKSSYCARSGGISGKNDKFSANYWSRKAWDC